MRARRLVWPVFVLTLLSGALAPVEAQGRGGAPARRQQLEQQLRRRLWNVTKERVGLTDAQMTKLTQTNQRFDARRRTLNKDERSQRAVLRNEIVAGDKADQNRIAAALDRLQQLQRQRVDLQAEEQRELATYMTPLQRAKYAALQEQVRRRVETLRRSRPDSSGLDRP
jgi:Spy/CpxP family protein refolding chaperone